MKDKIVKILLDKLKGDDGRRTIYCHTCAGGEDRCECCVRKEMFWGISQKYAEEIADQIIADINQ